ncbi:hypothetical protein LAC81_11310 [Ensifer adhaerens]|uniref:hypothetical protein n=1 Tax=Ensifer adhaerens TaxID=106592 RepID=UPI001CBB958E|nr:hypothetical protein [Ensifer adhaerens]MBZ7922375.1 hypothetical protein [Ensifer adhaerens]UAX91008.1 hypothetical protein LAC78_11305 [Ensifer adhaerens]UAX98637.1 hypothetical protein LAC80_11315 [Ensifer adhaerens]UAY06018.1 hypothetical protein LAC81_11310 [Ensifer adhaerens]
MKSMVFDVIAVIASLTPKILCSRFFLITGLRYAATSLCGRGGGVITRTCGRRSLWHFLALPLECTAALLLTSKA